MSWVRVCGGRAHPWRFPAEYSLPLHTTPYTPHQKNRTKMRFFLHIRKFFCTFALESYAGGSMSREKRFAMVLSWVGFGHIK